jgi:hypothetical protein
MSVTSLHRLHINTPRLSVAGATKLVTYSATLASVYLSVGFLFYYAAWEKLVVNGGVMPTGLKKAFSGSLFATIPGDNLSWILLGALEASVVLLLVFSLIRGEFLTSHHKPLLLTGLSVSMLALGLMGLSNNMIGDNAGALSLFTYFGLTAVVMIIVRQLAPYRPVGWLSGNDTSSTESGE